MRLFGFDITRRKALPLPQPRSAYQVGSNHNFLTNQSFAKLVDEGLYKNAVVQGCINAYTMTLNEPRIYAYVSGQPLPDHPLSKLLYKPNKAMSGAELLSFVASYVATGGNAYLVKVRNQMGQTIALYPYHDGQMTPVASEYEWIDHYEYKVDNTKKIIPASDVIHFRSHIIDPLRPHLGMSPILAAARGVDIYGEMEKITYNTLKNDAMPRGLISFPPEAAMNNQQIDLVREQFGDNYGGTNRGRTAVLSGGASYERISFNLEELQADNIVSRAEVAICQAFRVHPLVAMTYAGLMNSTYSNMEEAFKQFTTLTRKPIWNAWEETFEHGFADEYPNVELEFDLSEVEALKPSPAEQLDATLQQFQSNIITQNEARTMLGYDPDPAGDRYTFELAPPMPGMAITPTATPTTTPTATPAAAEAPQSDFPLIDVATHHAKGDELSDEFEAKEWKRQDQNLEIYANRIAKSFGKEARKLGNKIANGVKTSNGSQTKTDPLSLFNFSVVLRGFLTATEADRKALVDYTIKDAVAASGSTIEEFGNTNFETLLKEGADLSAAQITESVGTIRDELQALVTDNANATPAELSSAITNKFEIISTSRANLIGRTTATSVNGATARQTWKKRNEQIQDPKQKLVPVWITQNDADVRSSHRSVNRQPPNAQGTWNLNGHAVKYPGDPAAGAKEVCNCRCVLVPTRVGRL
mgnify:CR=1 FL=1